MCPKSFPTHQKAQIIVVLVLSTILLLALSQGRVLSLPTFQSYLPGPGGGWIYCGLSQGTAWITAPDRYTPAGGAAFHCNLTGSIVGWNGTSGAWDDRGYLIAFYPTNTKIDKPLDLTIEIDPAHPESQCDNCFVARYFDAGINQWQNLPTKYEKDKLRVHVAIAKYLPTCGYSGYADRFLVALFVTRPTTPTVYITPTAKPPSTATSVPTTSTPVVTIITPTSTEGPTATPSPTATSVPMTSTLVVATITPTSTEGPTATFTVPSPLSPTPTKTPDGPDHRDIIILALSACILILIGIVVGILLTISKRPR